MEQLNARRRFNRAKIRLCGWLIVRYNFQTFCITVMFFNVQLSVAWTQSRGDPGDFSQDGVHITTEELPF